MENNIVIDAHCHIFNNKCVTEEHRKRQSKLPSEALSKILEKLDKRKHNYNWVDKFKTMIEIGDKDRIEDVADFLVNKSGYVNQEDINSIFVPLMMDMSHEKLNKKEPKLIPFEVQVKETVNASLNNPGRILPFLAADPRTIRKVGFNEFIEIYRENGFIGMKVYPPLGYEPDDPTLIELYIYCQKHNIPVTTHCCFGGSYSTSKIGLHGEKLKREKDRLEYWGVKPHPKKWFDMINLHDLHNLKLNFGHFGGDEIGRNLRFKGFEGRKNRKQANTESQWRNIILNGLKNTDYHNLYTDVSFHPKMEYETQSYFEQLKGYLQNKEVKKHIMFGTDWWMTSYIFEEKTYLTNFKTGAKNAGITDSELNDLLFGNAKTFLGLNDTNSVPFSNYLKFLEKHNKRNDLPLWFRNGFNC